MNRSLSVVLPVGLIEGLAYNHRIAHPGSRFSFPSAALYAMYAMAELRHDLEDEVALAADGIPIPPPWPVRVKARPGCATPALKTSSAYEPLPAAVLPVLLGV